MADRRGPLWAVLGLLLVLTADCATAAVAGPVAPAPAPAPMPAPAPLVAYGHSYIRAPNTYARITAQALGRTLEDRARFGATIAEVEALVDSGDTRWTGGSDLVLLDATINDVLHRTPVSQFQMSLTAIVNTLTSTGAAVIVMMPVATREPHPGANPVLLARYGQAITTVAAGHPTVYLAHVAGWDPALDLGSDGVHPNDAGRQLLADAATTAARETHPPPTRLATTASLH